MTTRSTFISIDAEREYWDARAEFEDVWSENPVRAEDHLAYSLKLIEPYICLDDGATILDLGVGIGRLAVPMAMRHPEVKVIGVDISEAMLLEASRLKPDNLQLLLCDGRNLPVSEPLDGAYSMVTIQHIPREATAGYVEQLARLIKPGGVFRFQFVEGEQDEFQSHHLIRQDLEVFAGDDFEIDRYQPSTRYPEWRWVSMRKT